MSFRTGLSLICTLILGLGMACADTEDVDLADELDPGGPVGKEDNAGVPSLPVNGNYADTMVWSVTNDWEDTDTAAANEAGLAWGANSGLNWDEKYALWIESMEKIEGHTVSETFRVTTPWAGKSLPAPKLDCADVAITLRASFAAWFNLPYYVVAYDKGTAVFFGHFGIRTATGIWNNMPKFARAYTDHSGKSPAEFQADWPEDSKLRQRGVQNGDDQPFLGEGARTGTYLDEIHLNKRVGHFIRLLLIFTGSPHLADSRNTFNLVPEALREGDVLLWRWQRNGVGHTMQTMRVEDIGAGQLEAQTVFGNLPPNQPIWEAPAVAKRNFTNPEGGGHDGTTDYAPFGGGIKRWRVAKNVGGMWTNAWMAADEASWINDRDHERLRQRPEEFESLLGEVTPEKRRDVLVEIIESKREHLRNFPASCSARIKREEAFVDLYELMATEFSTSQTDVDTEFRKSEDYVFAELEYEESKTCCWNSSNAAMYDIVMDLNESLQDPDMCVQPLVFKARDGDYEVFEDHAKELGQASAWNPWSEDESCPQRDTQNDAEADHGWTEYCDWRDAG